MLRLFRIGMAVRPRAPTTWQRAATATTALRRAFTSPTGGYEFESNAGKHAKPVRGRLKGSGEAWTRYGGGASEAARALALDPGNISSCANQKQKSTGGYEFEYDDPTKPIVLPGEEWRDVV